MSEKERARTRSHSSSRSGNGDENELPDGWIQCVSKSRGGLLYYFNKETGKSSWAKPQKEASDVVSIDKFDTLSPASSSKTLTRKTSVDRDQKRNKGGEKPTQQPKTGISSFKNNSLKNETKKHKESKETVNGPNFHNASPYISENGKTGGKKKKQKAKASKKLAKNAKAMLSQDSTDLFGLCSDTKMSKKFQHIEQWSKNVSQVTEKACTTVEDVNDSIPMQGKSSSNAYNVDAMHGDKSNQKEKSTYDNAVFTDTPNEKKRKFHDTELKKHSSSTSSMAKTNSDNDRKSKLRTDDLNHMEKSKKPLPDVIEIPVKAKNQRLQSSVTYPSVKGTVGRSSRVNNKAEGLKPISLGRGSRFDKVTRQVGIGRGENASIVSTDKPKAKEAVLCKSMPPPTFKIPKISKDDSPLKIVHKEQSNLKAVILDSDELSDVQMDDSLDDIEQSTTLLQNQNQKTLVEFQQPSYGTVGDEEVESMDVDDVQTHYAILKEIEEMRYSASCNTQIRETLINEARQTEPETATVQAEGSVLIVLDTNVLLSHLNFVKDLIDYPIPGKGPPCLIIPWMVFQELDSLKSAGNRRHSRVGGDAEDKEELVSRLSRYAIQFLQDSLQKGHPRLKGETAVEANQAITGFHEETNDDSILHCCLIKKEQVKESGHVLLLSDDKNLCSKAMVHRIKAFSKKNLIDGLKDLFDTGKIVVHRDQFNDYYKELQAQEILAERIKKADEFSCELKCIIREAFSAVVEQEMKEAYDELWIQIVAIKPPWTLLDVVALIDKHWIAVFGFIVDRKLHETVKNLKVLLNKDHKKQDALLLVKDVIDSSLILCQGFAKHSSYNDMMPKCLAALTVLQKSCQAYINEPKAIAGPDGPTVCYAPSREELPETKKTDIDSNESEAQVPHGGVIDAFNIIWSAVAKVSSLVFDALNYPNPFAEDESARSNMTVPKTEAVHLLSTLCPCLTQVVSAIKSVLETPNAENNQIRPLYDAVSEFMVKIAKQSCYITVSELKDFCMDQFTRNALIHGLSRLDRALAMLQHCTSRASSL